MRTQALVFVAIVSLLPACGGGGSPSAPAPVPTPVAATRASISMVQASQGQICLSPVAGKTLRIKIPMRISESAGLGFNINAIRLSLYSGANEVERSEMTANNIVGVLGSNHVAALGVVSIMMSHDVNADAGSYDSLRYLAQFTDDRGNNIDLTVSPPFNVVGVVFCSI